ncbi:MAG TPA: abortive infection system antitoxin AbiGi family protein [Pyrinomonadaceae bacterium]|nr:abortive infection system antitoxin AbiGi family protein [Pyrinomonadaceae bacterium]
MKSQRYVSDELTHFAGSALDRERQYELLISIIRTGILKPRSPAEGLTDRDRSPSDAQATYQLVVRQDKPLSSNDKYQASVVCFADIPVEDLPFHIQKYSPFGVSFAKRFLLGCGANPVLYVARQTSTKSTKPADERFLKQRAIAA